MNNSRVNIFPNSKVEERDSLFKEEIKREPQTINKDVSASIEKEINKAIELVERARLKTSETHWLS